jgi:hypothetical protein
VSKTRVRRNSGWALRREGFAIAARYDALAVRIVVDLNTGIQIAIPPDLMEGLAGASPDDLADIEISPTGLGLHWPKLDADVYVPGLLKGIFGTKRWIAAELGAAGGKSRSQAKAAPQRVRTAARAGGPISGPAPPDQSIGACWRGSPGSIGAAWATPRRLRSRRRTA